MSRIWRNVVSTRAISLTAVGTLVILLALVAGCGGRPGHKEPAAVVAGFAVPCVGLAVAAQLHLRVYATEHGHTVATVVARYLKDHGHYRLTLPPGRYVISAPGSNEPPRSVVLRPGEHVTANFPDRCL